MAIHDAKHTMISTVDHTATNWCLFLGAVGKTLVSVGTEAAPDWSTVLGEVLVECVGETPVDADFSAIAENAQGFAVGIGGRVWKFYRNETDTYGVEMTEVPEA